MNGSKYLFQNGKSYNLLHSTFFDMPSILKVAYAKNAIHVCTSELIGPEGPVGIPCELFFQKEPKEGHDSFFVLYKKDNNIMIANGKHTADTERYPFPAVLINETDEIVYSTYLHDFSSFGHVSVDGGRSYGRFLFDSPERVTFINLNIDKDGNLSFSEQKE